MIAQYDVILARENPSAYPLLSLNKYSRDIDDRNGHGTHVSSIIASSAIASTGRYQGVAPGVNLVSVRVLNSEGAGRYFDVIRGIQWVVNQRRIYGIRVLNLSLSAPVQSHYWDDPLNQAVMAAWGSGIVVVVAAGNAGPAPMTIGVPGNDPYVITVGAVTDSYHPFEPSEYRLASFSSAGPTYEGFVKPEVVAMGGHVRAYAPDDGTLAQRFPQWVDARYPRHDDVGHFAGGRGHERRGRVDARSQSVAVAEQCEVPADGRARAQPSKPTARSPTRCSSKAPAW